MTTTLAARCESDGHIYSSAYRSPRPSLWSLIKRKLSRRKKKTHDYDSSACSTLERAQSVTIASELNGHAPGARKPSRGLRYRFSSLLRSNKRKLSRSVENIPVVHQNGHARVPAAMPIIAEALEVECCGSKGSGPDLAAPNGPSSCFRCAEGSPEVSLEGQMSLQELRERTCGERLAQQGDPQASENCRSPELSMPSSHPRPPDSPVRNAAHSHVFAEVHINPPAASTSAPVSEPDRSSPPPPPPPPRTRTSLQSRAPAPLDLTAISCLSPNISDQPGALRAEPARDGDSSSQEGGRSDGAGSSPASAGGAPALPRRGELVRGHESAPNSTVATPSSLVPRVMGTPNSAGPLVVRVGGWSMTRELQRVAFEGWYWGPLSRAESEAKLQGETDGTFLVRDSGSDTAFLTLSFRVNGYTLHSRIQHADGLFNFQIHADGQGFATVHELVNHALQESEGGVYCYLRGRRSALPALPVRLMKPLSRLRQVRSLQVLCRFVIRQHVRIDLIEHLRVPKTVKEYLLENRFC